MTTSTSTQAEPPLLTELRSIAAGMTAEQIFSILQGTDERSFVCFMRAEFNAAGQECIPERELKNYYQIFAHVLLSRLEELRAPDRLAWN